VVVVECPVNKEHGKVVDGWMAGESGGRRKGRWLDGRWVLGCRWLALCFDGLCARLCNAQLGAGIIPRCFRLRVGDAAWDTPDQAGKLQQARKLAQSGRAWRLAVSPLSREQGPHCIGMLLGRQDMARMMLLSLLSLHSLFVRLCLVSLATTRYISDETRY
jgi:hypothetical protein